MRWYDLRGRFDVRGVRGCRSEVREDLAVIDQLRISAESKAVMRAKIRSASLRKHLALDYYRHAHGGWAALWAIGCVLGFVLLSSRGLPPPDDQGNPQSLDALINIVAIIICLSFIPSGLRVLFNSKDLIKRALLAFGMSIFTIWSIRAIGETITYRDPPRGSEEFYTLASWGVLMLWPIAAIRRRGASIKRARTMCHAYDTLALAVLKFTVTLQRERGYWRRDGSAKKWVAELEKIAEIASYALACPNRSIAGDRDAEITLREESRRIAAVFRSHKIDIARAGSIDDIDAVIKSLSNGLMAILIGDREALLQQAPSVPPDPYMTIGRRVAPGATLVAFGITLPLIPAIADNPQAGDFLQWTLIVAGAVMLTSTNSEVAARVNEALGKSMAMKS